MILLTGMMVLLVPCMITDIRLMKVPTWYIVLFCILAAGVNFIWKRCSTGQMIAGIAAGGLFFLISRLSGQSIAYGDALMITGIGIWGGVKIQLLILVIGFLLAAVTGIIKKTVKKENWALRLPLAPFLGAAAVVVWILKETLI